MKLIILQQADEELYQAASYYEKQQAGLGYKFLDEVETHIKWISVNSIIPRVRQGNYRRINLKIFPFYIPYMIHQDRIWILAIAHSHRKPIYWVDRKDDI